MAKYKTPIPDEMKGLELKDLRLVTCFVQGAQEGSPETQLDQGTTVSYGRLAETSEALYAIAYSLKPKHPTGPPETQLTISATFGLRYFFPNLASISEEQLLQFGQVAGINHTWVDWREFVQSMTTRMGFPALRIPLLTGPLQFNKTPAKPAEVNPAAQVAPEAERKKAPSPKKAKKKTGGKK